MKLLILLATSLFFYTQATAEKKCVKEYKITESEGAFTASQEACKNLEGDLASDDLKDSENAKKAQDVINTFRQIKEDNKYMMIYLGITVGDIFQDSDKNTNHFVFSDGTKFDDTDFAFKWSTVEMEVQPNYKDKSYKCTMIYKDKNAEVMVSNTCDGSVYGLCKTYQECEDENSANSDSERSRANLPVFALFMACSVFKTFYVGIEF